MIFFSITFNDKSQISGKAEKIICNGVDITNYSKEEMFKVFAGDNNKMHIETASFKADFVIKDVYGFTF